MKHNFFFFRKAALKPGFLRERREKFLDRVPRLYIALSLAVICFAIYFFLNVVGTEWKKYAFPEFSEGDISPVQIIAPFDFKLPKPSDQLEEERNNAARKVLPVFKYERSAFENISSRIDSLFAAADSINLGTISDSTKTRLRNALFRMSSSGEIKSFLKVIGSGDAKSSEKIKNAVKQSFSNISELLIVTGKDYLNDLTGDSFVIDSGDTVKVEMAIELEEAAGLIKRVLNNELEGLIAQRNIDVITNLCLNYLKPNLIYDSGMTNEARRHAIDSVPDYRSFFRKDERIVDANIPITLQQMELLKTLKYDIDRRVSEIRNFSHVFSAMGKTIVACGFIGIVAGFLYFFRRKVYNSSSKLILLAVIGIIPVIAAFLSANGSGYSEFLIPVAIASILATIIFDAEVGILTTFGVVFITASMLDHDGLRISMVYFLSGCVGVFSVGRVRHRRQFYRAMLLIPITTALSVAATNNWTGNPLSSELGYDVMLGALNGFLCPIIAIGLLPLFESMFNVTTDITLLELSDLNNPLLKELAVKAPGTYSSVLQVGMLSEAAAEKVGANPLLCRVGAYYHDIGKIANSDYFIENQFGGVNPHDKLSPQMSALVIASHVKEGYELGVKSGLPEPVLDIIKQHHGTSLMESIYHKAVEEADGKPIEETSFRYPGPRPQTREAAIVMLSDLVEAVSRSLKDRTPNRLKGMINTIIQKRFMDGELDECELTLKDLHRIEESYLPILVGSYHGRIEYPWQKEKNEQAVKPVNNSPVKEKLS